jgi:hypothetical protein
MQDIFGGSSSSGSQSSQSGWALLPKEIQDAFTSFATTAGKTLNPGGTPDGSAYKLPALNSGSQSALDNISNGKFAITPDSFAANMKMLQDPYQQSVINQIQRNATGDSSQLSSYFDKAGDFGSNRSMLGNSDISAKAADQVGSFLSGEYNSNKNDALTTIPSNQAQSAAGAVQAGLTQQQQQLTNQQAPISALSQLAKLYGILPQSGGSVSSGQNSSSTSTGVIPALFG